MGNSVGSRYRYGASFVDRTSGVRFEGHHPVERPDLWKIYLNEAEGRYRNFGTEDALRRQILDDGDGVPLFFLGFDAHGEPWPVCASTGRWTPATRPSSCRRWEAHPKSTRLPA